MKKYLKFKFETSSNQSMANSNNDRHNNIDSQEEVFGNYGDIYPPLPPNSPPPDSPPTHTSLIVIKDYDDYDYEDNMKCVNSTSDMYHNNEPEDMEMDFNYSQPVEENGKEGEIMCRNFIRGTCTRGASCNNVHKVILSQLDTVYTFCYDFQNSRCRRLNCRFVHATIFEREFFSRTGYLPPHSLQHLTEMYHLPINPIPLHEAPFVNTNQVAVGYNPTSPILVSVIPVPLMNYMPAEDLDSRTVRREVFHAASTPRRHSVIDDSSRPPRDDDCRNSKNKCKHCDINNFRLQLIITKTEHLRKFNETWNNKITATNSKAQRLWMVLTTIMKIASRTTNEPGNGGGFLNISEKTKQALKDQVAILSSVSTLDEECEKVLKEQVDLLSSIPTLNEESNKIVKSGSPGFLNFLAKILIGAIDPWLPSGETRSTISSDVSWRVSSNTTRTN